MKFIYKFMEVYIWLFFTILCLLGAVQNIYFGHTSTSIGMLITSGIFLYVYIREKNRG